MCQPMQLIILSVVSLRFKNLTFYITLCSLLSLALTWGSISSQIDDVRELDRSECLIISK